MCRYIYVRNLFLIILLFLSPVLIAQSLKKIHKADSIFIYFKQSLKWQVKSIYINPKTNVENRMYNFMIRDSSVVGANSAFYHNGNVVLINKYEKFINRNRKILIDYEFYKKNEISLIKILMSRKPTFIIDQDEIKNGQLVYREVIFLEIFNQFPIE